MILSINKRSMKETRSDIFSGNFKLKSDDDAISIPDETGTPPGESLNLGQSTKDQSEEEKKTWDGFGKV